jgi:hypothetical protein
MKHAKNQNAKSLTLRISMSIFNLHNRNEGDSQKLVSAQSILCTCLNSIKEGNNTDDLIKAHELIDNYSIDSAYPS